MAVEVTPPMLAEIQKPHGPGNPHPLYGVDPNIMNEFGHTHYPKWVNGVLCKNKMEEAQLTAVKEVKEVKEEKKEW